MTDSHSKYSLLFLPLTALHKDVLSFNCTLPVIFLLWGKKKMTYFHNSFLGNIFNSLFFHAQFIFLDLFKYILLWKAIMNSFVNIFVNHFIHFGFIFFVLFSRHFSTMNVLHFKLGLSLTSIPIWIFFWIHFLVHEFIIK